jgi:hypothetical protein
MPRRATSHTSPPGRSGRPAASSDRVHRPTSGLAAWQPVGHLRGGRASPCGTVGAGGCHAPASGPGRRLSRISAGRSAVGSTSNDLVMTSRRASPARHAPSPPVAAVPVHISPVPCVAEGVSPTSLWRTARRERPARRRRSTPPGCSSALRNRVICAGRGSPCGCSHVSAYELSVWSFEVGGAWC